MLPWWPTVVLPLLVVVHVLVHVLVLIPVLVVHIVILYVVVILLVVGHVTATVVTFFSGGIQPEATTGGSCWGPVQASALLCLRMLIWWWWWCWAYVCEGGGDLWA